MKKKSTIFVFLLLLLSLSLLAQQAQQEKKVADATPLFLNSIIYGTICLAVAAVGGAFAQSLALRTAVQNIGRNPSASDSIRGVLIIGLALIESLVIYVLLVDLILYFVKWGSYNF